jgi:hypothetical protein
MVPKTPGIIHAFHQLQLSVAQVLVENKTPNKGISGMKGKDITPVGMPGFFDQMRDPGNSPPIYRGRKERDENGCHWRERSLAPVKNREKEQRTGR